jgi:outer membrane protein OmpA-like peptidoglycan-associated protein
MLDSGCPLSAPGRVRDALLEDGVTPDRIDDHWMGDREPPVPTANGVRESRNRVVEVSLR